MHENPGSWLSWSQGRDAGDGDARVPLDRFFPVRDEMQRVRSRWYGDNRRWHSPRILEGHGMLTGIFPPERPIREQPTDRIPVAARLFDYGDDLTLFVWLGTHELLLALDDVAWLSRAQIAQANVRSPEPDATAWVRAQAEGGTAGFLTLGHGIAASLLAWSGWRSDCAAAQHALLQSIELHAVVRSCARPDHEPPDTRTRCREMVGILTSIQPVPDAFKQSFASSILDKDLNPLLDEHLFVSSICTLEYHSGPAGLPDDDGDAGREAAEELFQILLSAEAPLAYYAALRSLYADLGHSLANIVWDRLHILFTAALSGPSLAKARLLREYREFIELDSSRLQAVADHYGQKLGTKRLERAVQHDIDALQSNSSAWFAILAVLIALIGVGVVF